MAAGMRQRRRHMADGDRANAPFGLRRLARIVDDEWINDGHRPKHRLGRAILHERRRLARQPFKRAMGAAMDHRIDIFDAAGARHRRRHRNGTAASPYHDSPPCDLRRCRDPAARRRANCRRARPGTRMRRQRASASGAPQCACTELDEICAAWHQAPRHNRRVLRRSVAAASSRWRINASAVRERPDGISSLAQRSGNRGDALAPCRVQRHSRRVLALPG